MGGNSLNKTDVKNIVKDEIEKFYDKNFANKLKEIINKPNSPVRKELLDTIKKALVSAHKFMYIRKDVWTNDIK